jgi:N-methylhydantoinase A/oxoprolinase/acetone carboxylase beta subunit
MSYVIGIDIGGTFTDAVATDDRGTVTAAKTRRRRQTSRAA